MGNYQKLTNPSKNDLLYIIDVDGGRGGRPITKVIEKGDLVGTQNDTTTPGESAYQLAVRLGFQGTEQQWLATLKGKDGNNLSILTATADLSIAGNGSNQASINLGDAFMLTKVTTNISNVRVRLYLTQAFANADISRVIGGTLPTSHGLIYDAVFSNVLRLDVLPSAIALPQSNCTLVVNNLSNTQQNISVTFNYLQLI